MEWYNHGLCVFNSIILERLYLFFLNNYNTGFEFNTLENDLILKWWNSANSRNPELLLVSATKFCWFPFGIQTDANSNKITLEDKLSCIRNDELSFDDWSNIKLMMFIFMMFIFVQVRQLRRELGDVQQEYDRLMVELTSLDTVKEEEHVRT